MARVVHVHFQCVSKSEIVIMLPVSGSVTYLCSPGEGLITRISTPIPGAASGDHDRIDETFLTQYNRVPQDQRAATLS